MNSRHLATCAVVTALTVSVAACTSPGAATSSPASTSVVTTSPSTTPTSATTSPAAPSATTADTSVTPETAAPSTTATASATPSATATVVATSRTGKVLYAPEHPPVGGDWPWTIGIDSWGPVQIGAPVPAAARSRLTWLEVPEMGCDGAWFLQTKDGVHAMVATVDQKKDGPAYRITINQPGVRLASGGEIGQNIKLALDGLPRKRPFESAGVSYAQTNGRVDTIVLGLEPRLDMVELVPTGWSLGGDLFYTEWHC